MQDYSPLVSSWAFSVSQVLAPLDFRDPSYIRSTRIALLKKGQLVILTFSFIEAGMFPGCFYLIGMWYKRQEAQKRFSFFFSSTTLAGGFGGLIAAGIGEMDGMRGYENWRWVSTSPRLRDKLFC